MIKEKERFSAYLQRRYSDRSTPKHYLNDLEMLAHQDFMGCRKNLQRINANLHKLQKN